MKQVMLSLLPFAFALSCVGQMSKIDPAVTSLIKQFTDASQSKNAQQYASVFSDDAHWQGPEGQDAIGPTNIEPAVTQCFDKYGALQTYQVEVRQLGAEVIMAQIFQGNAASVSHQPMTLAPGSAGPLPGFGFRTWLILGQQQGHWRVIGASIADIRPR